MKKNLFLLICLVLFIPGISGAQVNDSLSVMCTPELEKLVAKWADGYNASKSSNHVRVSVVAASNIDESMLETGIAFINGDELGNMPAGAAERFVIGRNIVVAVMNSSNPFIDEIMTQGIPADRLAEAVKNSEKANWGYLLGSNMTDKASMYVVDDRMVMGCLAYHTSVKDGDIDGTHSENAGKMLSAIINDRYSVGFCRLADICSPENQKLMNRINFLPIDRDGNGSLDYSENIYKDITSFERGVWIGKYPKTLYTSIFSVSAAIPSNENIKAFLNWIISDGEKILGEEGYTSLTSPERMAVSERISTLETAQVAEIREKSVFRGLFIGLVIVIAGLLVFDFVLGFRKKKPVRDAVGIPHGNVFDERALEYPRGIYFDKTHTWAFMEQTGTVKVGIDDFLLHMTGPLSRVRMKKAGDRIRKGEEILSVIQNGKQLNLYSPVTGIIRERNAGLENDASILNSSPYSDGWVYRIEPENWQRENQLLFMADRHRQFIAGEIARIKDMLTGLFNTDHVRYAVVLQDGGSLHEGALSDMGPEVWEEFQSKIIDPSRQVWFYEII